MKKWYVTCALHGKATCVVEAEIHGDAIEAAKESGNWELDEWDCDWSDHRGSINASEVK